MTQLKKIISENITAHTMEYIVSCILLYSMVFVIFWHILTNYIFAYYCYAEANLYLSYLGRWE